MKHLRLFFKSIALLIAFTILALPAHADRVVKQLQFGKQTIEVGADEVITFQDMNGYTGISSSSSNNSQSLTVFKPAEGMAIQITFANLDVRNDGTSWPAYVNVYAGDPEGNRVVKYIYIMESGTNVITVTEPLLFYDDGGPNGKITKGFKGTVTFVPGRENSAVQVNTVSTFSIGSGKMMIYSGSEVNPDNVLGKVTGYSTTTGPENLVSKAEDGSLTIVFEANTTATTLDGWEMKVKLHEKTPYTIESIAATNTTGDVMRNSQDNVMQQLKLEVSGDKDPITEIV